MIFPATGILMATELEARPFLDASGVQRLEKKPFPVFRHDDFNIIISGIGKANSAMAASYLIYKYGIQHMFNLGAAGAAAEGFSVGEIFQITSILEYDRPSLISMKPRYFKPDLFGDFKKATLATQDRAVVSAAFRKDVAEKAQLVDMEGASFVQACRLFGSRSYLFKIVTDTPEHTADRDIIDNIKKTRSDLYNFFMKEIIHSIEKSPEEKQ